LLPFSVFSKKKALFTRPGKPQQTPYRCLAESKVLNCCSLTVFYHKLGRSASAPFPTTRVAWRSSLCKPLTNSQF
jgi:hypothetical protein